MSSNLVEGVYYVDSHSSKVVPFEFLKVYEENEIDFQLDVKSAAERPENEWHSISKISELSPHKRYWFKLALASHSENVNWLFTSGFWHHSRLYYQSKQGDWINKNLSVFQTLSERDYPHNLPFSRIPLSATPTTVYIQAEGYRLGRNINAQRFQLVRQAAVAEEMKSGLYFQGAFLGFTLGISGFHLVLWFWFREKAYLWLVATGIASPLFFHAFYGFGLTQIWPNHPVWNEYSPAIMGTISMAFFLRFGITYLNLNVHFPKQEKLLTGMLYLSLVSALGYFTYQPLLILMLPISVTIISAIVLVLAFKIAFAKFRYAWYFIAANAVILFTLILWSLRQALILDNTIVGLSVPQITQIAIGFQGVLLALGMIDRMQNMKETILQGKLEKEKMVRLQAEQTQRLMQAQNAELASTNFALNEVDQLKDEFLAKTSHELNTPLNGIIGLTQVLLDDDIGYTDKERKEYLELIASRGEHLKELVVELLEFTKTRRDVVTIYPEVFYLAQHVSKILLTFKKAANEKGLSLNFDDSKDVQVFADARRVRQIFSILIDNAIKYSDKGEIKVSLFEDKDRSFIEIEDQGIGIDAENINNIFEPFKQVSEPSRPREGAGLGLSICKHLVELHEGEIRVKSVVGQGTIFTISFPRSNVQS